MKSTYNHHNTLVDWQTVDRSALTDEKVRLMRDEAQAFLEEQRDILAIQGQKAQHLLTVSVIVVSALLAYSGTIVGAGDMLKAVVLYPFMLLSVGCIVTAALCVSVLQIKYIHNTHRLPEVYFKDDFYKQSEQNMVLAALDRMNNLGIFHGAFIWRNARLLQWSYRILGTAVILACLAAGLAAVACSVVGG